jgi:selenocysteine lyase/cysteine desulfurase
LSAACRSAGALLLVDGVQAVGATPVDASVADFYCASVFKWLLSGFGLGIVVVRERGRDQLEPLFRGYNNPAPSRELQYSHTNYPGLTALTATLAYIESEVGWARVFERVAALTDRLDRSLGAHGLTVATPRGARAGIVSCVTDDPARARDALAAREGLLRISPHFYNAPEDVDAFADALRHVI